MFYRAQIPVLVACLTLLVLSAPTLPATPLDVSPSIQGPDTAGAPVDFDKISGASCVNPPQGMFAWWPFDEDAPATTAEILGARDGRHINGPAPTLGKVGGALNFDGNDYVEVSHHSSLNVGTGDFSVDAWIRTTDDTGVKTILDKRTSSPAGVRGFHFYLFEGDLGFQLADRDGSSICSSSPTSACTNYGVPSFVADGAWHHVAVTVDRDNPTGMVFYVDGVSVGTANPTLRSMSLDNTGPVRFGVRAFELVGHFDGDIDEVELFHRVLSPTEVAALHAADSVGKCKERLSLRWDHPFCLGENSKGSSMEICNDGVIDQNYSLLLLPESASGTCTIDGPDSFALDGPPVQAIPPAVTVEVPARTCQTFPFTIDRPTQMLMNRDRGCFEAIVTNLDTGSQLRRRASVQDWRECCSVGNDDDVTSVGPGEDSDVTFSIVNTSGGPLTFDFRIESEPAPGEASTLSLDGQAPGTPITGTRTFADGETLDITFSAGFPEGRALVTEDVMLEVDTGNGVFEVITSTRVRSQLGPDVFTDGFESGDTSAWTTTLP